MIRYGMILAWLAAGGFGLAQTPAGPVSQAKPAVETNGGAEIADTPEGRKLASLKSLADSMAGMVVEVDKLRAELKQTVSEERKAELNTRIESERAQIRELRANFQNIVGGEEAAQYDEVEQLGKQPTVQGQVQELVQPILAELRNATSRPREMEALRRSLESWRSRMVTAEVVNGRIDPLLHSPVDSRVSDELKLAKRIWAGRLAEAEAQVAALTARIAEKERLTPSLWETISQLFVDFWRSRGLNLLIALVVAMAGFVAVRRGYQWLWRVGPLKRRSRATLMGRLADVTAVSVAVLTAVGGVLLVFYVRGDWLLLTVAAILLLGVAWGSKAALPPYFDQIRLILNLGAVREGERVVYQGIPWKVRSLGMFSKFVNPALEGGVLRLPLSEVMPMVSRHAAPKEPWFPTAEDDWVILSDGTYGKVITQTPEQVVVLKLGGSLKTYPTAEFLAATPENLSTGFRVTAVFGIDYQHLAGATDEVVEVFSRALTTRLIGKHGRELIRSVTVEFASAAASALEYLVQVDCAGGLASRLRQLERMIQSVCVEVCEARGWVIPFTQLTIHQAEPLSIADAKDA
ncbi:MAG: hypothetical protein K9N23_12210 [Akkermansiaceae bacterium]|nr:hypothetical protein [Akkermansiaceae bacterium]